MRPRVSVLDAGLNLDGAFIFQEAELSYFPIDKLKHFNTFAFDIIVLPSYADPFKIELHRSFLNLFLENGGIILCFYPRIRNSQWFDSASIFMSYHKDVSFEQNSDSSRLLHGIHDPSEIKEHDEWFSHGYFTSHIETIPIIFANLENNKKGYVIGIQRFRKNKGELLISTTDFDYHYLFGPAISSENLNKPLENNLQMNAAVICNNITEWSMLRFSNWPKTKKITRRFLGLLSPLYMIRFVSGTILLGLLLYLGYKVLSGTSFSLEFLISTIIAIIALGVDLVEKTILYKK